MSPFLTVLINAANGAFLGAAPEGAQLWALDVPAPTNLEELAKLQSQLVPAIKAFDVPAVGMNVVVLRLMVPKTSDDGR